MTTSPPSSGERRQYFRIDDDVYLEYQALSEADYLAQLAAPLGDAAGPGALTLQLRSLTAQASALLAQIRKRDMEIGQYLALIDRKVELLGRAVLGNQFGHDLGPNAHVNLSGGGIGFTSAERLAPGTKLDLHLVLFPSTLLIRGLAQVIDCAQLEETDPQQPYLVNTEFTHIAELAREALIRHTLELQSARLRQQRGEPN